MSKEEREMWEEQLKTLKEIRQILKESNERNQELVMCSNCNEFVPEDYGRHTEHDGFICEQCLNDGYGQ